MPCGILIISGSRTAGATYICCAPDGFTMTQKVDTNWLFTARARLGWAADKWLVYGTGGVAVTKLSHQSILADTFGANENVTYSDTKSGWAAGGGIECAFLPNWTVRGEYLYVRFDSVSSISLLQETDGATEPTRMFHSANLKANIARVGLSYQFH